MQHRDDEAFLSDSGERVCVCVWTTADLTEAAHFNLALIGLLIIDY